MRIVSVYIFFFIVLMGFSSANAALVSYNFVAEQTSSSGTPTGGTLVDTADGFLIITGTISYDTDGATDGSESGYQQFDTGTIAIDQFSVPDLFQFSYNQDNSGQNFGIVYQGIGGPTTLFHLQDSSDSLYSNLVDLPLALFLTTPVAEFVFSNGLLGSDPSVTFGITSLSSTAVVPLPGALPMMMGAIAGFAFFRRKIKR